MVYGIIKKHNGFIEVNSAEKIGTKFSVFIPAKEVEHVEDAPPPPRQPSERRPVKIMVVDDEPDLREFCAAALGDIATEVLTASNGLEALEVFQRADFDIDLVVLDLTMPKMAGPECAYLMRTMKPTLKILISSGYGPDVTADPQLEGQVAGFLPKPYDLNQLIRKVEEVLDLPETVGRN
jgi:DNA-binding NtrC family response regulator